MSWVGAWVREEGGSHPRLGGVHTGRALPSSLTGPQGLSRGALPGSSPGPGLRTSGRSCPPGPRASEGTWECAQGRHRAGRCPWPPEGRNGTEKQCRVHSTWLSCWAWRRRGRRPVTRSAQSRQGPGWLPLAAFHTAPRWVSPPPASQAMLRNVTSLRTDLSPSLWLLESAIRITHHRRRSHSAHTGTTGVPVSSLGAHKPVFSVQIRPESPSSLCPSPPGKDHGEAGGLLTVPFRPHHTPGSLLLGLTGSQTVFPK